MTQVIQIRLKISNAFLILGEKLVLVDTGSSGETSTILNAINQAGLDIKDLSLILHTHAHFDHCGCTADLQEKSGALVAIHKFDSQAFLEGRSVPIKPINLFGKFLMYFMKDGYQPTKIDILIDDEFDLHSYGVAGKVIMTPGHTPGSISVLLDNGEVIAGDLLGGGRLLGLFQPERPRYHHWYLDMNDVEKSIARVMATSPKRLYVGHGGPLAGNEPIKHFSW